MALQEFDLLRKKTEQRANADKQTNQDALQRKFAAMGGLNSGAAIKTQQLASEQADQQKQEALAGVDAQEGAETQRRTEIKEARDFQSGEAQKGRDFQQIIFNAEQGSRLRQLDLADKQFAADREDQAFNTDSAFSQLGKKEQAYINEQRFARSHGYAWNGSPEQKASLGKK